MLGANIKIQKGSVFVHRVFDVAHEIDLNLSEKLLNEVQGKRLELVRDPYKAIIMREAPLTLNLGEDLLKDKKGKEIKVLCSAKIWHYGVIAISLQVPLESGIAFKDLVKLGAFLDDAKEVTEFASSKKNLVFKQIENAANNPWQNDIVEDYTTYLLEKISLPQLKEGQDPEQALLNSETEVISEDQKIKDIEIKDPKELLKRVPIPELILGEDEFTLAEQNRKDLLSTYHQYTNKDLLILDWNSAVIIDFTGKEFYRDYIDILEFSLSHLLELRVYDTLLDDKISTLYDSIEQKRGRMFTNMYSDLAEDAGQIYIEFSEFFERIDNSLKTVGDYHLAKVFRSASKKFRFEDWQQNIKEKLESLAKTSEILQGEVNSTRSHVMEFIILVMIAIEVIPLVYSWVSPYFQILTNYFQ